MRLRLADWEFDALRDGISGCILNSEGVGGGFPGRDIQAAGMRGPDRADRGIVSDTFGVGAVIAELRGFPGANGARRYVEAADSGFGTAQLLNGESIFFALLLGLALFCLSLEFPAGFVARVENVGDIEEYAENGQGGIKEGVF